MPQIEVTFDIDANGIVNVSAKDLGTGKTQQVTITGGTALSQDEIDEMVKDAETHANEDATRREQVEARNQADHAAYSVEKQLKEHADKLSDEERAGIEDKVTELRKLLTEDSSPEDLRKGTEELFTAAQLLGQKIYEASQTSPEGGCHGDGGDGDGDGDDVVEAEIVDDVTTRPKTPPSERQDDDRQRHGGPRGSRRSARPSPTASSRPRVTSTWSRARSSRPRAPRAGRPRSGAARRPGGGSRQLLVHLAQSRAEADEYLSTLQRVAADFDNYRRRVERDQSETVPAPPSASWRHSSRRSTPSRRRSPTVPGPPARRRSWRGCGVPTTS